MTALRPIRQVDKWVADVAWGTQELSMLVSNPVVIGDTLFGLSNRNSGQFFAIDASTGQVLSLGNVVNRATSTRRISGISLKQKERGPVRSALVLPIVVSFGLMIGSARGHRPRTAKTF